MVSVAASKEEAFPFERLCEGQQFIALLSRFEKNEIPQTLNTELKQQTITQVAKFYGHVFDQAGVVDFDIGPSPLFSVPLEGARNGEWSAVTIEYLAWLRGQEKLDAEIIDIMTGVFVRYQHWNNLLFNAHKNIDVFCFNLANEILKIQSKSPGIPVIFPLGYSGKVSAHAAAGILWHNYLIISNRGSGNDNKKGLSIYDLSWHVGSGELPKKTVLKSLLKCRRIQSGLQFKKKLATLSENYVKLDRLGLVRLNGKLIVSKTLKTIDILRSATMASQAGVMPAAQAVGNCSFSSATELPLTLIYAILQGRDASEASLVSGLKSSIQVMRAPYLAKLRETAVKLMMQLDKHGWIAWVPEDLKNNTYKELRKQMVAKPAVPIKPIKRVSPKGWSIQQVLNVCLFFTWRLLKKGGNVEVRQFQECLLAIDLWFPEGNRIDMLDKLTKGFQLAKGIDVNLIRKMRFSAGFSHDDKWGEISRFAVKVNCMQDIIVNEMFDIPLQEGGKNSALTKRAGRFF